MQVPRQVTAHRSGPLIDTLALQVSDEACLQAGAGAHVAPGAAFGMLGMMRMSNRSGSADFYTCGLLVPASASIAFIFKGMRPLQPPLLNEPVADAQVGSLAPL